MSDKRIFLALGSNLGNRLEHLKSALKYLETHGVHIEAKSRVWETAPWGETNQPTFLNMCAAARTTLDPSACCGCSKTPKRNSDAARASAGGRAKSTSI